MAERYKVRAENGKAEILWRNGQYDHYMVVWLLGHFKFLLRVLFNMLNFGATKKFT